MDISVRGEEPRCYQMERWSGFTTLTGLDIGIDISGELDWKSSEFSPHNASVCDEGVVWTSIQGAVGLLGSGNGKHVWKVKTEKGKGNRPIACPVVHRDMIYISKERGVYAHCIRDGALQWHVPNLKLQGIRRGLVNESEDRRWLKPVAVYDGVILLGGRADVVQVIDIRSGKVLEQLAYTKHMIENVPESYQPDWLLPEEYMALRRNSCYLGGGWGIRPVIDGMQYWFVRDAVKKADAGPHHQHQEERTVCLLQASELMRDTTNYVLDRDSIYIHERHQKRREMSCYSLSDGKRKWTMAFESSPVGVTLLTGNSIVVTECPQEEKRASVLVLNKLTGTVVLRRELQVGLREWPRSLGVWKGKLYVEGENGIQCYR